MKGLTLFQLIFCVFLISCSHTDSDNGAQLITNTQQNGSYQGILIVNGEKFITAKMVGKDTYEIDKEVGEVKKRVNAGTIPTEDFSSNLLKVGVKIYSVKGKEDLFLAELNKNKYYVFSKPVN